MLDHVTALLATEGAELHRLHAAALAGPAAGAWNACWWMCSCKLMRQLHDAKLSSVCNHDST